jgi:hypothetical protein
LVPPQPKPRGNRHYEAVRPRGGEPFWAWPSRGIPDGAEILVLAKCLTRCPASRRLPRGSCSTQEQTHLASTTWHAVEFSRYERSPFQNFRSCPGQLLYLSLPAPSPSTRLSRRVSGLGSLPAPPGALLWPAVSPPFGVFSGRSFPAGPTSGLCLAVRSSLPGDG